jgi:pilus assembly protein FimV
VRRRRAEEAVGNGGFSDSLLSQESTVMGGANSLFGGPGGQSVDTSQHSVFGADFRLGPTTTPETNEVDPIAEADVYIAYGRDAQAEEILREALERDPERPAIRMKLLEIYASRQDATQFAPHAQVMHARTGGVGSEWAQVAAWGRALDPADPMYADSGATGLSDRLEPADTEAIWLTQDPNNNVDTRPLALGDLALPLDAFPTSPGVQGTQPNVNQADDFGRLPPVHLADSASGEPRPLEMDLSGISLDLGDDLRQPPRHDAAAHGVGAVRMTEGTQDPFSSPAGSDAGRNSEIAQDLRIKVDLAKAYLEIGDQEGARELLESVMQQADGALRSEAEALLTQMG